VTATLLFADSGGATFVCRFGAAKTGGYEVLGTAGHLRVDPGFTTAAPLRFELTGVGRTKSKEETNHIFPEPAILVSGLAWVLDARDKEVFAWRAGEGSVGALLYWEPRILSRTGL